VSDGKGGSDTQEIDVNVTNMIENRPLAPTYSFDDDSNYLQITNFNAPTMSAWAYSLDGGTHWETMSVSTQLLINEYGAKEILLKHISREGVESEISSASIVNHVEPISLNFEDSNDTVYLFGLVNGATYQYKIDAGAWQNGEGNSFVLNDMSGKHEIEVQELLNGSVVSNGTQTVTITPPPNDADTTAPIINGAVVSGNILTLTYDDILDSQSSIFTNLFSVKVNGSVVEIDNVYINNNTAVLTLHNPVVRGDSISIKYTDKTIDNDANVIQNRYGVDSESLSDYRMVGNATPNAEFSVQVTPSSVYEGTASDGSTTTITYTVYRSGDTTISSSVDWALNMGTMSADDFEVIPSVSTLTFAPNTSAQTLVFEIKRDSLYENDEVFGVTLSNPINGVIVDSRAVATIQNDDLQIESQSVITEAQYSNELNTHLKEVGSLFDGSFIGDGSRVRILNGLFQQSFSDELGGTFISGTEQYSITNDRLVLVKNDISYSYKLLINNVDALVFAQEISNEALERKMNEGDSTPPAILTLVREGYTPNVFDTNNIVNVYHNYTDNYGDEAIKTELTFSGENVLNKDYDINGELLQETQSTINLAHTLISGNNSYGSSWQSKIVAEVVENGQNLYVIENKDMWSQTINDAEGKSDIDTYLSTHNDYLFRETGIDLNENGSTNDYVMVARDNDTIIGVTSFMNNQTVDALGVLENPNLLKATYDSLNYTTFSVDGFNDEVTTTEYSTDYDLMTSFAPYSVEYFTEYTPAEFGGMYEIELHNGMDLNLNTLTYPDLLESIDSVNDTQVNTFSLTVEDVLEIGVNNGLIIEMGSNDILDLSSWTPSGTTSNGYYSTYTNSDESHVMATLWVHTTSVVG